MWLVRDIGEYGSVGCGSVGVGECGGVASEGHRWVWGCDMHASICRL